VAGSGGRRRAASTGTVLWRIAGRLRPYRWQSVAALLIVVTTICLGVASPLLLLRIIDQALPERDAVLLGWLCGALVMVGTLSSVLAVAGTILITWISQRVTTDLRVDVYDRVGSQPLDFYRRTSEAQVQGRLVSDVGAVDRLLTNTCHAAISAVTGLIVAVVVMLLLSWPLAIATLGAAALLSLVNHRFADRRRTLADDRQRHLTGMLHVVAESLSLSGVTLGRTLRRTAMQRVRFVDVCERIRDATVRQRAVGTVVLTVIAASFAAFPPVIYLLAGTVFTDLSVGGVVVLVIMQMRLAGPLQSLLRLGGSLQSSVAMCARVLEYLDLPGAAEPVLSGAPALRGPVAVSLRGVGHRYQGAARSVLSGVDLDLPAGSVTVVAGPSGSGKSTLAMVLAGLLKPDGGVGYIDGVLADTGRLREVATLVPQHTMLLSGSIRDNLGFVRDDLTEPELDWAVSAACLDDLIQSLPLGYRTQVGRDGYQLSGGERQRIAIARALLARSRLLVFDEATSALDGPMADRVHANLRECCRDRTLVLVAHRIPRLAPDDQLVVVRGGCIVECGPYRTFAGAWADQ
jgi:ATP-binding cassette, subfamily B, bacterial